MGEVRGTGEDARRDTATARSARARRRMTRTRTRFSRSSGVIYNKWRRQRRWREGLDRGLAPSPRAGREGSSTSRGGAARASDRDGGDALSDDGGARAGGVKPSGSIGELSRRERLVWTPELHAAFIRAVEKLGVKTAVPKAIMKVMNVDGLTRENVASHLQKYRLQLKRAQDTLESTRASGDAEMTTQNSGDSKRRKRKHRDTKCDSGSGQGRGRPRERSRERPRERPGAAKGAAKGGQERPRERRGGGWENENEARLVERRRQFTRTGRSATERAKGITKEYCIDSTESRGKIKKS